MNEVYNFLINDIKLKKEDIIVVGVSAGPDSMALLYILNDLKKSIGFNIIVAHVNHNVRKESYEEKEFLEKYCCDNSICFESMIIDKYGDDNFHNEARNIRYKYYEELINKYGANYLMTGHHGDDLIETILMRIVRGSTLKGYSGFSNNILMGNYRIVRPLTFVTKDEIALFDKEKKIPYRIDQSNYKEKYTRNRYRMHVLPFLKEEDKLVHKKFMKFSRTLMEADDLIERLAKKEMQNIYVDGIIDVTLFKKIDIVLGKRIIDYIFSSLYRDDIMEIDDRHVDLVLQLINSKKASAKYNLPNDFIVVKEYNKVYFMKESSLLMPYDIELSNEVFLPNNMTIKKVDECSTDGNDVLRLSSSDITLPLRVRTRREGDRMSIKNMNGTKKVSDILINAKVDRKKRDLWPIVVDAKDTIVWIPKIKKSKYNRLKSDKCDIIFKCL